MPYHTASDQLFALTCQRSVIIFFVILVYKSWHLVCISAELAVNYSFSICLCVSIFYFVFGAMWTGCDAEAV